MKYLSILMILFFANFSFALDGDQSIEFLDVLEGSTGQRTITITNDTGQNLTGANSYLLSLQAGGDKGLTIISDTCLNTTLADTESCSIGIQFAPTAATDASVRDYFRMNFRRDDNTLIRHSVFIGAKKVLSNDPAVGANKTNLDFGFLRAGDPRGDRRTMSITITNNGELASSGGVGASISNDTKNIYSILRNDCTSALNPAESCRILVSAEPRASENPDRGTYISNLDLTGLGDGSDTAQLTLESDIENILIPEVSYPLVLTRDEGQALKYTATSPSGSVQVVDPSVTPDNQDANDFMFAENNFDPVSFCKDDTSPGADALDEICGVVVRFIPTSNPQAVYEINIKHPLNDGN